MGDMSMSAIITVVGYIAVAVINHFSARSLAKKTAKKVAAVAANLEKTNTATSAALAEIKKDVNSSHTKLAEKLTDTEQKLLVVVGRAATAEAKVDALEKERPQPVEVIVPPGEALPVKSVE